MEIIQCSHAEETKKHAAEALSAFLLDAKNISQSVLLLLSGGSAFSILEHVDSNIVGSDVTIGMLDERFSKDETVNNFAQFSQLAFYKEAVRYGASFIDTRVKENESQSELADRFEQALRSWKKIYPEGVCIATMGMGANGHTAGIMPFPENPTLFQKLFDDDTHWVAAYDAETKNPYPLRVTVTLSFLRQVMDHAVIFIAGREKEGVLNQVLSEEGTCAKTPARVVRDMKDAVLFCNVT